MPRYSTPGLTPRQRLFVSEYLVDLNATQAAIRSGYSAKNADKIGPELLGKARVREAVDAAMAKRQKRTEITQDYVLNGIQQIIERCVQAEPVRDRNGAVAGQFQFEPNAALKGHELLGKHLKLFTEKREHSFDLGNLTDDQIDQLATNLKPAGTVVPGGSA